MEVVIISNKINEKIIKLKSNIKSHYSLKFIILNLKYLNYLSFNKIYLIIKPFIRWFIIIHISIIFGSTIFFTFFYLGEWFRMLIFDIYSCLMALIQFLIWFSKRITLKYFNISALRNFERKVIEDDKKVTELNNNLETMETFLGLNQVAGSRYVSEFHDLETKWIRRKFVGNDLSNNGRIYVKLIYYVIPRDVIAYHDQLLQEKWTEHKLKDLYETAFKKDSIFDIYNNYLFYKIFMERIIRVASSDYLPYIFFRIVNFVLWRKSTIIDIDSNKHLKENILYKTFKKQHLRRREKKKGKYRFRGVYLDTLENNYYKYKKEGFIYNLTKFLFGEEIILTNRAFRARYWELVMKHKKQLNYKLKTYKERQTFYNEFLRGDFNNEVGKIFINYKEQKEEKMKKLFFLWIKKKQELNNLKNITNINKEREKYNIIQKQLEQIVEKTNNSLSLNLFKSEYLQLINKSVYYKIYLRLIKGEKFINVRGEQRFEYPEFRYVSRLKRFIIPEPFNFFKYSNNITNMKLEKDYISKLNAEIKNTPLLRHNRKVLYKVHLINCSIYKLRYHYIHYRNTIPIDNALEIILQKELYKFFKRRVFQNIDFKDLKETSFSVNEYKKYINKENKRIDHPIPIPTKKSFGIQKTLIRNMDSNYSLQTKDEIFNKDVDNFFLESDINHSLFSKHLLHMRGWYPIRHVWKTTIREKHRLLISKLEHIIRNERIRKKIFKRRMSKFRKNHKYFNWYYYIRKRRLSRKFYRKFYLRKVRYSRGHFYYGKLKRFDRSYYGRIKASVYKTYGMSTYFSRNILKLLKRVFGFTPGSKYHDIFLEETHRLNLREMFFKNINDFRIKRDRFNILKNNDFTYNLKNYKLFSKSNQDLRDSIKKEYRIFKVKSYYLKKTPNKGLAQYLDDLRTGKIDPVTKKRTDRSWWQFWYW